MAVKLYAAAGIALAMTGLIGGVEVNNLLNYRYTRATVLDVSPPKCSVSNEKWYVVFRRKTSISSIDCATAEMLVGYDDDMKGGEVAYDQPVKVSYLDAVDGKTKEHVFHARERFVVQPGGQILIRTHKSKPGVVNSGQWTEDLSRLAPGA
ncbi:MAG: hypothetical protein IPL88_13855 [Rhizobiales bacterium]|nr:hypothetical protein [Hyphomicrobiales bacterium]